MSLGGSGVSIGRVGSLRVVYYCCFIGVSQLKNLDVTPHSVPFGILFVSISVALINY